MWQEHGFALLSFRGKRMSLRRRFLGHIELSTKRGINMVQFNAQEWVALAWPAQAQSRVSCLGVGWHKWQNNLALKGVERWWFLLRMRAPTGPKGCHGWRNRWTRTSYLACWSFCKQVSVQHMHNSLSPGQTVLLFLRKATSTSSSSSASLPSGSSEILGRCIEKTGIGNHRP